MRSWRLFRESTDVVPTCTLRGHHDWVTDMVFTPDERIAITSSNDRFLKVWNLKTQQCLETVEKHTDYVECLAYSDTTKRLVSAGLSNQIFLWDVEHFRKPLCDMTREARSDIGSVYCVAMDPRGTCLVSGSTDLVVRAWDPRAGKCIFEAKRDKHLDNIRAVAMNDDGTMCVTAGADNLINLWDIGQQQRIASYCPTNDHEVLPNQQHNPSSGSIWTIATNAAFTHVLSAGGRHRTTGGVWTTDLVSGHSRRLAWSTDEPIIQLALDESSSSVPELWVATARGASLTSLRLSPEEVSVHSPSAAAAAAAAASAAADPSPKARHARTRNGEIPRDRRANSHAQSHARSHSYHPHSHAHTHPNGRLPMDTKENRMSQDLATGGGGGSGRGGSLSPRRMLAPKSRDLSRDLLPSPGGNGVDHHARSQSYAPELAASAGLPYSLPPTFANTSSNNSSMSPKQHHSHSHSARSSHSHAHTQPQHQHISSRSHGQAPVSSSQSQNPLDHRPPPVASRGSFSRSMRSRKRSGVSPHPVRITRELRGAPAVIKATVLNDGYRLLSLDMAGRVILWDVIQGEMLHDYGTDMDFDKVLDAHYVRKSVPSWFSVNLRLGCISIRLDRSSCFNGFVHEPKFSEEKPINFGYQALRRIFSGWLNYEIVNHKRRKLAAASNEQVDTPAERPLRNGNHPSSPNGGPTPTVKPGAPFDPLWWESEIDAHLDPGLDILVGYNEDRSPPYPVSLSQNFHHTNQNVPKATLARLFGVNQALYNEFSSIRHLSDLLEELPDKPSQPLVVDTKSVSRQQRGASQQRNGSGTAAGQSKRGSGGGGGGGGGGSGGSSKRSSGRSPVGNIDMPRTLSTPKRSSERSGSGTHSPAEPVASLGGGRLTGPGSYSKWRESTAAATMSPGGRSSRSWSRGGGGGGRKSPHNSDLPSPSSRPSSASRAGASASPRSGGGGKRPASAGPRRRGRSEESDYSSSPEPSPQGAGRPRSADANGADGEEEAFVSEHLRETGEYVSYKEIAPDWVRQVLLSGNVPAPRLGKIRFELHPEDPDDLPSLGRAARLAAQPNLQVTQIYDHLERQFEESKYDFGDAGVDENGELLPIDELLEVVCEGQVVSQTDDLQTVRDFIKKTGTSLVFYYRSRRPLGESAENSAASDEYEGGTRV